MPFFEQQNQSESHRLFRNMKDAMQLLCCITELTIQTRDQFALWMSLSAN